MPIKTEEFSDIWFKQRAVIEFLTAEKIPPIEIHRQMQAVYGDQCIDVSGRTMPVAAYPVAEPCQLLPTQRQNHATWCPTGAEPCQLLPIQCQNHASCYLSSGRTMAVATQPEAEPSTGKTKPDATLTFL